MSLTSATVITVSDGVTAGEREDLSGAAVEAILDGAGFEVARVVVPDEKGRIAEAIRSAAVTGSLVVTTGGTGLGPRDVTPEATAEVIERDAPGLVHLMMTEGIGHTPLAALSRARAGAVGSTLVVNLPGSPRGATESLEAVIEVIPHALRLLVGDTDHH